MLVVEQIHEIWNFKRFLEPLGVVFSGLVPTPGEPSACHSWRFVTRVELFRARGSDDFSIDQGMLIDGDQWRMAHDLDVVLLVKQWVPAPIEAHTPWPSPPRCTLGGGRCSLFRHARSQVSSSTLAQSPLLVLLHDKVASVPQSTELLVAPKNPLNARTATEFRKTATAIRKEPWCLYQGAMYLENLVDLDRTAGDPPIVSAIFEGFGHSDGHQLPLPDVADLFALCPPRIFSTCPVAHLGSAPCSLASARAVLVRLPTRHLHLRSASCAEGRSWPTWWPSKRRGPSRRRTSRRQR